MTSTPGQRALWRLQRQMKASQPLKQSDLDQLSEEMEVPAEIVEYQKLQQSTQTPMVHHISPENRQQEGQAQGSKDTPSELPPKVLSKQEKEWKAFYETRFGPLVVLVLMFFFRNMERARFYAPSPEECKAASVPLAKATVFIEKTLKVPSWVHELASESDDYITLGMVCFAYLERIGVMSKFQNVVYPTSRSRDETNSGLNGSNQSVPTDEYIPYGVGLQYSPD